MSHTHEVISAFVDQEPFDPNELASALSEPAGRDLLIDLIALRHLVQLTDAAPASSSVPRRWSARTFMAAAAVLVALAGGYVAGQRGIEPADAAPPEATRVVESPATWQALP